MQTAPSSGRPHWVDVTTRDGLLRGTQEDGIAVFRGVRYAQPCKPSNRFNAPQAPHATLQLQDARHFGPPPLQPQRSSTEHIKIVGDIDCLTLNIWAPHHPDSIGGIPVMVWLPGGGFMRCDANDPLYDGSHFACQHVIVITVNYRVGIEGFLYVPGMEPNRGLQDQILALKWIQRNIHSFGGDPSRVTIFGQSAGAGAAACLMGMPEADGLFQQAILQSPSVLVQTVAEAELAAQAIADLAGCPATAEGFASIPPERASHALALLSMRAGLRERYGLGAHHRFPLRPVVDGQVLQTAPLQGIARNPVLPRAVLIGANKDEARLYMVPNGSIHHVTASDLNAFLIDAGLPSDTALHYRRSLPPAKRTDGEVMCAIQSDYYYRTPARQISRIIADRGYYSYVYEFRWHSPLYNGELGAAHGVELPFVFKNMRNETARNFIDTRQGVPHRLADTMHHCWLDFVKNGTPGWPAQTKSQAPVMLFDDQPVQALSAEDAISNGAPALTSTPGNDWM